MHNFPTHFWRRFQEHKDRTAVATIDKNGKVVEETFWQWTRRVQRLAIALLEAGFKPGTRIAMTPAGGRDWLDLAFASWLVGGCLVVIPADRPRVQTLRALARTGSEWVVVRNAQQWRFLRGPNGKLPPGLRWIAFEDTSERPAETNFFFLNDLDQQGRSLAVRGWVDTLARVIYDVKPDQPTLILFEPELGEDPHGAFFSGEKVGAMLDFLGEDLQLNDDACVISALDYGNFPTWLLTAATLLQGKKVATATSLDEASSNLHNLNATHLICGPTFLERRALRLRADLEETNPALQSDGAGSSAFGLAAMLSQVGKEAARKLFFDPLAREFGARLKSVYLLGGRLSPEFTDVLERADINLLGLFGRPECGISHIERPEARKRDTVGRPVQGFACKIAGARREHTGEILVRSHTLFDGYWDDQGPREIDADGWLHTGQTGHIQSGYLFLED